MKVEVKYNSRLSELERNLSLPVQEVAIDLAARMVQRIQLGQAAQGHFTALGAQSQERPGSGLFWVSPDRPQPPGYVTKPTTGPMAGWAGYRSYRGYTEAMGSPPRRFKITRQMLDSLKVRVMGPGRVKVAFYGAHKRAKQPPGVTASSTTNSGVAWLTSRNERDPMLMPSRVELDAVKRLVFERMNAIAEASTAQGARRRAPATPRARR